MDFLLRVIQVLPLADWLALGAFFAGWVGYVRFAKARSVRRPSVLASTNRIRQEWMLQTTYRDNRIVDAAVSQSMATSPSFFASTTIFIIGGLIAAVGATDKTAEMVQELPFAARTSVLVLDLKLLVLTGIFVHAFFRFTWSMRQYSFGALLIGSAPSPQDFSRAEDTQLRRRYAERAGRVMGLGADLLMGFPGESEAEFEETRVLAEKLPLTYAHVFPFSPRPGTIAADLPGHLPR